MTPEAQQIAIAEACGWRFVTNPVTNIGGYWEQGQQGKEGYRRGDWGSRECLVGLPDYLSDLNAMHEAEKVIGEWRDTLSTDPEKNFTDNLIDICSDQDTWYSHATAAQRAEAFLRTLNLWDDQA